LLRGGRPAAAAAAVAAAAAAAAGANRFSFRSGPISRRGQWHRAVAIYQISTTRGIINRRASSRAVRIAAAATCSRACAAIRGCSGAERISERS